MLVVGSAIVMGGFGRTQFAPTMLVVGYATFQRLRVGSVGLILRREVGITLDDNSLLLFECWGDFVLIFLIK
jgi:hypothetical protein